MRGWVMMAWAALAGSGIGSAVTYKLGLHRLFALLDSLKDERDKAQVAREEFVVSDTI